jgi:hypothetical protein
MSWLNSFQDTKPTQTIEEFELTFYVRPKNSESNAIKNQEPFQKITLFVHSPGEQKTRQFMMFLHEREREERMCVCGLAHEMNAHIHSFSFSTYI